jgi:hypothetical protein
MYVLGREVPPAMTIVTDARCRCRSSRHSTRRSGCCPGRPARPAGARRRAGGGRARVAARRDRAPTVAIRPALNLTRNVAFATVASADVFSKPGRPVAAHSYCWNVTDCRFDAYVTPIQLTVAPDVPPVIACVPKSTKSMVAGRPSGRDAVPAGHVRAGVERDVPDAALVRAVVVVLDPA